jgi:hypothetical protein
MIWVWALLFLAPQVASAETVSIAASADLQHIKIDGLDWKPGPFEITTDSKTHKSFVVIEGVSRLQTWKVSSREAKKITYRKIDLEATQGPLTEGDLNFKLENIPQGHVITMTIPLRGDMTHVKLVATSMKGQPITQEFDLIKDHGGEAPAVSPEPLYTPSAITPTVIKPVEPIYTPPPATPENTYTPSPIEIPIPTDTPRALPTVTYLDIPEVTPTIPPQSIVPSNKNLKSKKDQKQNLKTRPMPAFVWTPPPKSVPTPTPKPIPAPTPKPIPAPTPKLIPAPTPKPIPTPTPKPSPTLTPRPLHTLTPAPIPTPTTTVATRPIYKAPTFWFWDKDLLLHINFGSLSEAPSSGGNTTTPMTANYLHLSADTTLFNGTHARARGMEYSLSLDLGGEFLVPGLNPALYWQAQLQFGYRNAWHLTSHKNFNLTPLLLFKYQTLPMASPLISPTLGIADPSLGFQVRNLNLFWIGLGAKLKYEGRVPTQWWSITPVFSYSALGSSTLAMNHLTYNDRGWKAQIVALTTLGSAPLIGLDLSVTNLAGDVSILNLTGALLFGFQF